MSVKQDAVQGADRPSQSHGDSVSAPAPWESAKRRLGPNGLVGSTDRLLCHGNDVDSTMRMPLPASRRHPSVDKQLRSNALARRASLNETAKFKRLLRRIIFQTKLRMALLLSYLFRFRTFKMTHFRFCLGPMFNVNMTSYLLVRFFQYYAYNTV